MNWKESLHPDSWSYASSGLFNDPETNPRKLHNSILQLMILICWEQPSASLL